MLNAQMKLTFKELLLFHECEKRNQLQSAKRYIRLKPAVLGRTLQCYKQPLKCYFTSTWPNIKEPTEIVSSITDKFGYISVTPAESGSLLNTTTTHVLVFIMHAEFNCVIYVLFKWINTIISSIKNSNVIQFIGHPGVWLIVTSQMLLLYHFDVIENNGIGNNAAIPLVEKFKLLININEWITHVQENNLPHHTR